MCHHWCIAGIAYSDVWIDDDPAATVMSLDEGILNDAQEEVGI